MRILIALLVLFFAPIATAQTAAPSQILSNGCWEFLLCDSLAADGDCNYASFLPGYSHTLYVAEDADTEESFTCTVRSSRDGYSATYYGTTNPAITVTNAVEVQPFDALLYTYWLNCSGIDGGDTITVYDYACPLAR